MHGTSWGPGVVHIGHVSCMPSLCIGAGPPSCKKTIQCTCTNVTFVQSHSIFFALLDTPHASLCTGSHSGTQHAYEYCDSTSALTQVIDCSAADNPMYSCYGNLNTEKSWIVITLVHLHQLRATVAHLCYKHNSYV